MQVTLQGHRKAVSALGYSRSGALLASGGQDTDIIVWDPAEEAGLYRLRGHLDEVTALVDPQTSHSHGMQRTHCQPACSEGSTVGHGSCRGSGTGRCVPPTQASRHL